MSPALSRIQPPASARVACDVDSIARRYWPDGRFLVVDGNLHAQASERQRWAAAPSAIPKGCPTFGRKIGTGAPGFVIDDTVNGSMREVRRLIVGRAGAKKQCDPDAGCTARFLGVRALPPHSARTARRAALGALWGIGGNWPRTARLGGPARPNSHPQTSDSGPNPRLRDRRLLARRPGNGV